MASGNVANTNGWDTVSAIPMGYANEAIKQQKSSPTSFSGSFSDFGTKYNVTGRFGDWALWGGTGTDVNMNIPFTGGQINPAPGSLSGKFGAGEAVVTVKLGFIPQPTDDNKQQLLARTTTKDPIHDPVVVIVSVTFASATDQKNYENAVSAGLKDYLNGHLQDFNHVFAVCDINIQADKASFQWLKPTDVAYAVEGPSQETPTPTTINQWVFGVLAMTEKRTPPAAAQVSINAIPTNQPGVNGGFLISQERFLRKLFMPGIEKQFVGAKDTDFDTTNDGATITNVTELQLSPLTVPDADPQPVTDAKIGTGSFQINALDQHIELEIGMSFTWKTGYVCTLQYTGTTYLTFKTVTYKDPNGNTVTKNVLQMPESGKPTMHYIVTKTTAEKWEELIDSIVISVAGAIAGGLLGGAVGGAADAAETAAVDGATDAAGTAAGDALEGTMEGIDNAAADNLPQLEDEALGDASEGLDNPSKLQKFGSFLRASWKKILGSILGGVAGTLISEIPSILEAEQEKKLADIPSLDDFATEAVSPNTWANTKSFAMVSLQLNRSMQFGLKFVPKT